MAGSKGKGSRAGYQKKQANSLAFIMSPFYDMPSDYDALVKDYRTLAKAADTRLVRIEKLSKEKGYGDILGYAYRRAMYDIESWSGEGATRFNRKPPESVAGLKAKIQDIKNFMAMDTSTKTGIKSVEQKRADTLNEKYGTNFTPAEISKFFASKLKERMENKVKDSATMLKVIGVIRRNRKIIQQKGVSRKKKLEQIKAEELKLIKEKKQFIKDVEDANRKDQQVPDEMVLETLDTILKSHAPSVRAYLTNGVN